MHTWEPKTNVRNQLIKTAQDLANAEDLNEDEVRELLDALRKTTTTIRKRKLGMGVLSTSISSDTVTYQVTANTTQLSEAITRMGEEIKKTGVSFRGLMQEAEDKKMAEMLTALKAYQAQENAKVAAIKPEDLLP